LSKQPGSRTRTGEIGRIDSPRASALLSAIVASSDDAIISKDLDGIITSWNEGAQRIFGYTAEEAIGRSITLLIPPDRQAEEPKILEQLERGERVDHFETVRQRKDGSLLDISVTISPIRDANGRIIGASKVARDISDRRRAGAELERQRAIIDQLNEIGRSLSAELDLEKLLQTVTDIARRLSGARFGAVFYNAPGDCEDRDRLSTFSGAPREAFGALFAPALAGEPVIRLDDVTQDARFAAMAPDPGGHFVVRSYLAVPIVARRGRVIGRLALGHPEAGVFTEREERLVLGLVAQAAIAVENAQLYETEQRLRMESEKASRSKDEFLAMLGHELRNPLSSVRNAAVAGSLDPSLTERAFEIVRRGADQLARLVDDLLDVARITQGKIALRRDRVRLASVVEHALETARELTEQKRLEFGTSLPKAPLDVDGDQTRLEQVVMNLIANAAKFTEPGGQIQVILEQEGPEAVLRVRDNGIGIAPDLLPQVFDLFTQGESGLARTAGGLGIGLTVARQIIGLHGGRIEAHSQGVGAGAEFVVRLPALPKAEAAASKTSSSAAAVKRSARVLIVEDNEDAAYSLAMLLQHFGHRVEIIRDGAAAIAAARRVRPELMIVDIGLPGMDGYEVARRVRGELGPEVILVALTGYGGREERDLAGAAGFDHHFTKPIDPQALRALAEALPSPKAS
jgi:PAS domain S-box-containing protein